MRGARSGPPQLHKGGYVRLSGSIAKGNPRTGQPHAHNRERERNARRAARAEARDT